MQHFLDAGIRCFLFELEERILGSHTCPLTCIPVFLSCITCLALSPPYLCAKACVRDTKD